jgi:hypothetical protein
VELLERAVLTISPVHSEDWRTEIISFLQGNCLSDDEVYNKRGVIDSRLEGGVNRAKLKFTKNNHNYKPGLALVINESAREGAKQIASK